MKKILSFLAVFCITVTGFSQGQGPSPAVNVTIQDDKPLVLESNQGIDPRQRLQLNVQGNMMVNLRVDNQTMHLGFIQTMFHIDGQVIFPGNPPGQMLIQNKPLPKTKSGKERTGFVSAYKIHNMIITQVVEVVPTKAKAGKKRQLDAAMVRYYVDNKDDKSHTVGIRIFMDVFIVDNDGALFAAPNQPNKILNGVELKGKQVPDYLQFLQRPDLKNPGFVAHMTYNFGKAFAMPDRVVLTRLGAFVSGIWRLCGQAIPPWASTGIPRRSRRKANVPWPTPSARASPPIPTATAPCPLFWEAPSSRASCSLWPHTFRNLPSAKV
jgi:hypothetical protein